MFTSRREFIKKILSVGIYSLSITPSILYASLENTQWLNHIYSLSSYKGVLSDLFTDVQFIDTNKIEFTRLPDIAENGAVVPIIVNSRLKNVEKISILVENNPYPLIAEFYLSSILEPRVSARFKMAKTSDVIVIIEAEGKFYRKIKNVKVAIGGCG
jgi:sulfur-oxidizing protein SoxY